MRFLIDEDVPIEVVRALREAGHDAELVFEVLRGGTADQEIWRYAVRERAIVITCNRDDFLALAGNAPETGLIILNRRRTRQSECAHVLRLLSTAGASGIESNINFA